jgi:hypothetical protein
MMRGERASAGFGWLLAEIRVEATSLVHVALLADPVPGRHQLVEIFRIQGIRR